MGPLATKIQTMYGYTDYEMAIIKYSITALLSELSKILILGTLFAFIGKFDLFIAASVLLILLRVNGGGYHCKHYITCLLMTACILGAAVICLPLIQITNYSIILLGLTICLFITYYIGPVPSPFRPKPDMKLIKRCHNNCFITIFVFIMIVSIFNSNMAIRPYLIVGFWTTILNTLQLVIAKIIRKGEFAWWKNLDIQV